jgi:hypothetical protein
MMVPPPTAVVVVAAAGLVTEAKDWRGGTAQHSTAQGRNAQDREIVGPFPCSALRSFEMARD